MILVVGDSMLDRYWEGTVERISPEAPVPILKVTREFCRPGGAANVAANIKALGEEVSLLTLIGADEPGDTLRGLLQGVDIRAVYGTPTAQKIRSVAKRQQMLRTDFEAVPDMGCVDVLGSLFMPKSRGVVVFSDYAKGALRDVSRLIEKARGCKTLVDPKGDLSKYRGAFLLKPNEAEIGGYDERKCHDLRRSLDVQNLLVTLGERGMVLFDENGAHHIPSEAREVYDVSGAGDTVIATLAVCLERGQSVMEAVRQANKAAGIVVGKFGTATVTDHELRGCTI
jgi:D-glycero-beta-D-manno-heptose-7-phosphate kinase